MTQEDKQLLLVDLCARLPYKVKGQAVSNGEIYRISSIISVSPSGESLLMLDDNNIDFVTLKQTKPYLRPMSSMTVEEKKDYELLCDYYMDDKKEKHYFNNFATLDWLNQRHFDYRGLIKLGLALEAPEGIYNIKD